MVDAGGDPNQQGQRCRPLQGGRYARTEEELYKKALALLEKCKIEPGRLGQEIPELESAA